MAILSDIEVAGLDVDTAGQLRLLEKAIEDGVALKVDLSLIALTGELQRQISARITSHAAADDVDGLKSYLVAATAALAVI